MVTSFVLFYLFAILIEQGNQRNKLLVLSVACIALMFIAGFRDPTVWPDTGVYVDSFLYYTPNLFDLTASSEPLGYSEYGFYYLGAFFKLFSSDAALYLTFIAGLSFFFLYKDFKRYCVYPLLGLCAYIARFYLGRNLIQIRAGLSYAIILWAVQYITQRDWKRYFFWVLVAYQFHQSAIIAIPLYFLGGLDIKKVHIIWGILLSFFVALVFSGPIQSALESYAVDLNVATTYIQDEYKRELGLANPMIYLQCFLLFGYTYAEKKLAVLTGRDYYTIRTAYFYSTIILIVLSSYTALSGRTSSMFATLEMVIIPSLSFYFSIQNRWAGYLIMGVSLTIIFAMNYYGH